MIYPNRNVRNALLILIFIILNSADCSKRGSEPTCYFSEDFISYALFNEGSFWIYQNQFNIRDTVRIIKIEYSISDAPNTFPFEDYKITSKSTLNGDKKFRALCRDKNHIDCTHWDSYSTNYYHPILFFCCCEEGTNNENLTYLHQLDSIEVGNTFFYSIKVFESDSIHPQGMRKLYYSKNIGLIMYENFDGSNWQLIDYDVFNAVTL